MLERRNRRAPRNLSSHREGACGRASSEDWRLTATTDSGGVPRSHWEGSPPARPRALAARGTDGRARGASAPRPRLTVLLDEAQTAVIMLVAPAGYGKTTLAYEWLGDRDGPSAWHGCSPASADIAALALGIADAAATIVPG